VACEVRESWRLRRGAVVCFPSAAFFRASLRQAGLGRQRYQGCLEEGAGFLGGQHDEEADYEQDGRPCKEPPPSGPLTREDAYNGYYERSVYEASPSRKQSIIRPDTSPRESKEKKLCSNSQEAKAEDHPPPAGNRYRLSFSKPYTEGQGESHQASDDDTYKDQLSELHRCLGSRNRHPDSCRLSGVQALSLVYTT
jgi:hypothetical protein